MAEFSCMALTPDFLIWGTDMGGITYFYIEVLIPIYLFLSLSFQLYEEKFILNINCLDMFERAFFDSFPTMVNTIEESILRCLIAQS